MSDFDSPWKEALDRFLPAFIAFFFPDPHAVIDWSRPYEILDKELQQVVRDAELKRRLADKLFKVWLRDGQEVWVLVHVEIQGEPDDEFPERMYVYNYRVYDRYRRPVVSLAVLGDDQSSWRPDRFGYSIAGCSVEIRFPVVKLLDYGRELAALEANPSPFAAVALAHLKTKETRNDLPNRRMWKLRVIKSLYGRGLDKEDIRELFRLIDWMMDLPRELEKEFIQEVEQFEEERKMKYVTHMEQIAREEGLQEGKAVGLQEGKAVGLQEGKAVGLQEGKAVGLQEGLLESIANGLQVRFGAEGLGFLRELAQVQDLRPLRSIQKALWTAQSIDELRALLN